MENEKRLIELMMDKPYGRGTEKEETEHIEDVVEYLIDNGVTVQKWIPVTERLPEKDVLVLCVGAKGGMFIGNPRTIYGEEDTAYTYVPNSRGGRFTKYWMPLPVLPKK